MFNDGSAQAVAVIKELGDQQRWACGRGKQSAATRDDGHGRPAGRGASTQQYGSLLVECMYLCILFKYIGVL
jgi:hypothetical protein